MSEPESQPDVLKLLTPADRCRLLEVTQAINQAEAARASRRHYSYDEALNLMRAQTDTTNRSEAIQEGYQQFVQNGMIRRSQCKMP